jgi:methylenetetrahydrofolate reductase (NADPH)
MRIIDKITRAIAEGVVTVSFEYFPPKTPDGLENLYERMEHMARFEPLWIDVTMSALRSSTPLTLEICRTAHNLIGLETMMHLTCAGVAKHEVDEVLQQMKRAGIENVLALRGDPPAGQTWQPSKDQFAHASDLVRHIRATYGDSFCICVAGYPEGHQDAVSYEQDLLHLKDKVDAGADLVITQLFFDGERFTRFLRDCRALGISVPILPGIMPIHTYNGFQKATAMSGTSVPAALRDSLLAVKDDDEAVRRVGGEYCLKLCKQVLAAGSPGIHFYTFNLETNVARLLEGLSLASKSNLRRDLPWRTTRREDVRPIFWHNRP